MQMGIFGSRGIGGQCSSELVGVSTIILTEFDFLFFASQLSRLMSLSHIEDGCL